MNNAQHNPSITYEVIANGDIVVRKFIGNVSFDESIESWNKIINLEVCDRQPRGVISDFSESGPMDSSSKIQALIDFFKQHDDFFKNLLSASIVKHPDKTASGELVKRSISDNRLPFRHELFYSIENAIGWMQDEFSLSD